MTISLVGNNARLNRRLELIMNTELLEAIYGRTFVKFVFFLYFIHLLEKESNLLCGEFSVDGSEGLELSLDIGLVLAVKENLHDTLSVNLYAGTLTNNLGRVHNVVQDSLLNCCESSGTRARSLCPLVTSVGLAQNCSLGDNNDVTSRELLLQFADESQLNLVERSQKLERNIDNNGLLAVSAVNILGSGNVQIAKGGLKLSRGHLKVEEFLRNGGLKLIRFLLLSKRKGCQHHFLSSSHTKRW
jgi:hypothetical protein